MHRARDAALPPVPPEQSQGSDRVAGAAACWGERAFQVRDPNGVIVQLVDWNASPDSSDR
jgi:hypothetical protein